MPVKSELRLAYYRQYREENWLHRALSRAVCKARERAVRNGTYHTITQAHVFELLRMQNDCCAVTGLPFERTPTPGTNHTRSVSIDKKNPDLGYVDGNVRLILHAVNSLKGSGTDEEMLTIAKAIVEKADDRSY